VSMPSFNDGVTSSTTGTKFYSASAHFTQADVGSKITISGGTGAPYGTFTISSVTDDVTVVLSAAPGAALKALAFTIDARGDTTRTNGVANGTTTYTSATAAFTSADVGKRIKGTNIPASTTIASVTNATTVVLSANATTGTGLTFTIENRGYLAPAVVTVGAVLTATVSGLTVSSTNDRGYGYTFTVVATSGAGDGRPATTAVVNPT